MGTKRSHDRVPKGTDDTMDGQDNSSKQASSESPIMSMFEKFRAELDEHHDRRERIIKASRDVTAASKKIIFTLQRIRQINSALPPHVAKAKQPYNTTIATSLTSVTPDLQDLNTYRYSRQISGGCQEWMEAASFSHYITTGTLLSYPDAASELRRISSSSVSEGSQPNPGVFLTPEDYVLGLYDMTGELMRFAITTMATSGSLPVIPAPSSTEVDAMEVTLTEADRPRERTLLTDLRALRAALEGLEVHGTGGPFAKDVEKKAEVMRESVEKVERALYGLVVRGAERPKGWMPSESEGNRGKPLEVEG